MYQQCSNISHITHKQFPVIIGLLNQFGSRTGFVKLKYQFLRANSYIYLTILLRIVSELFCTGSLIIVIIVTTVSLSCHRTLYDIVYISGSLIVFEIFFLKDWYITNTSILWVRFRVHKTFENRFYSCKRQNFFTLTGFYSVSKALLHHFKCDTVY